MSNQLERRLDELQQERALLRESIRRIGHTFASNLDRPVLLELTLQTAVDGVKASSGRLRSDLVPMSRWRVAARWVVRWDRGAVYESERIAMSNGAMGDASSEEWGVVRSRSARLSLVPVFKR